MRALRINLVYCRRPEGGRLISRVRELVEWVRRSRRMPASFERFSNAERTPEKEHG